MDGRIVRGSPLHGLDVRLSVLGRALFGRAFPTKSVVAAMATAVWCFEIRYAAISNHSGCRGLSGEKIARFIAVAKPAEF